MSIYIYAANADDFSSLGLCGALVPTKCEHEEDAGGPSVLTMEHPLDERGRWRCIEVGCVIRAPVPVRTTPAIEGTTVVTQVVRGRVRTTATKSERVLWSKREGGKKVKLLSVGQEMIVAKNPVDGDRYGVRGQKSGSGWIAKAAVELLEVETLPGGAGGIEAVEPAWSVRDQLFRVYEIERADDGVVARARHISYDLLGNMTLYNTEDAITCQTALDGILGECAVPHEFEAYTDVTDARVGFDAARIDPIKALSDPETGVLTRWAAELVRDNWELFVLKRAGIHRGARIEYGKNLLGVECGVTWDKLVTRVLPVGQSPNGDRIYLTENPQKAAKQITAASYIVSARDAAYAIPHIIELPVSEAKMSAAGKDQKNEVTEAIACERMRAAAHELLDSGVDMPEINLVVKFVQLGDTEEYAQYAQLERVFLYDTVRVVHRPLEIEFDIDVVRVVFDCITERYIEIELGALRDMVASTFASWQIPNGLSGDKIALNAIGAGHLVAESVTAEHIRANTIEAKHIVSDTITAEQINANSLMAQKIVSAIATIIEANIKKAQIGEAEIDWASIIDLRAVYAQIANAQIGSASINYAQIMDLVAGTAIISEGVGGKLHISRLAVTEANIVSLSVGELLVKGNDGCFYALTVNEDGDVCPIKKEVTGGDVADHSILGSQKLIEGSITAETLDVDQIFASSLLASKITGAHLRAGIITAAHVTSDFGSTIDISSNTAIRTIVNQDTVREMIAGSTRELRVSYDGVGTHLVEDSDTTTMTAQVYEAGVNVTDEMPSSAFLWERDSGDPAADAAWAAERVGARQITITKLDVVSRCVISCTLLSMDGTTLSFRVDPDTLMLIITEPPSGMDTASYDPSTGMLTIDGEGYVYDAATQTITANNGATSSRTRVQFTFSEDTGLRSKLLQLADRISLVVEDDQGQSSELRVTLQLIEAMAREFNVNGKLTVGALSQSVRDDLAKATTALSEALAAKATASSASSTANNANSTATTLWQKIVNLCYDANMTYIDGACIYSGTISADKINANNLYAYRLRDPAVESNSWLQLTTNGGAYEDGQIPSFEFGLEAYRNNAKQFAITTTTMGYSLGGALDPQGTKRITFTTQPVGVLRAGCSMSMSDHPDGNISIGDAYTYRAIRFYVAPTPYRQIGQEDGASAPVLQLFKSGKTGTQYAFVSGSIRYTGNVSQYSDRRAKKDIKALDTDILMLVNPVEFRMIGDDADLHWGFVAQDVADALREDGHEDSALYCDDMPAMLGVAYTELIAPLVAGYQKHERRIAELEKRLEANRNAD